VGFGSALFKQTLLLKPMFLVYLLQFYKFRCRSETNQQIPGVVKNSIQLFSLENGFKSYIKSLSFASFTLAKRTFKC